MLIVKSDAYTYSQSGGWIEPQCLAYDAVKVRHFRYRVVVDRVPRRCDFVDLLNERRLDVGVGRQGVDNETQGGVCGLVSSDKEKHRLQ